MSRLMMNEQNDCAPVKTQTSLGIRSVLSESSLSVIPLFCPFTMTALCTTQLEKSTLSSWGPISSIVFKHCPSRSMTGDKLAFCGPNKV